MAVSDPIICAYLPEPGGLLAVERSCEIASRFGSDLVVAVVAPPPARSQPSVGLAPEALLVQMDHVHVEAEVATVQRVAGRLQVGAEVVRASDVADVIELAASRHARLIVVANHDPGVLERLFAGDPSGDLTRGAACDVLVVHPNGID